MTVNRDYLTIHPLTDLLPVLSDEAMQRLAEDIRDNGQRDPITVWKDRNVVVDGRHRLTACALAGVEPVFEERDFADDSEVLAFIASRENRRHQKTSQKAMWGARLVTTTWGGDRKTKGSCEPLITMDDAARCSGASKASVKRARRVLDSGDERLIAQVEAGKLTVSQVVGILRKREAKAKRQAEVEAAKQAIEEHEAKKEEEAKKEDEKKSPEKPKRNRYSSTETLSPKELEENRLIARAKEIRRAEWQTEFNTVARAILQPLLEAFDRGEPWAQDLVKQHSVVDRLRHVLEEE